MAAPERTTCMSKEIIINSDQKQTRIAIVESGKLAELFIETKEVERTIGNLFLGRIRRIMPSIQAAFVDIGQKQDAFLHFSDLVDNLPDWLRFIQSDNPKVKSFKTEFAHQPIKGRRSEPRDSASRSNSESDNSDYDIERIAGDKSSGAASRRTESINPVNYLKRDARILVRISKEPIASKGSRVTTDISLAGRFLVLVPLAGYVAVSKKIVSYKERRRLKALAKSLVPEGFGVIVRTVAEGHNAKSLDTDLGLLIQKWGKVEESLAKNPQTPCGIHEDVSMASSIIRDFFSEDFDRILIDNERLYRNIKGYVQAVAPQMASRVHFHEGKQPLFRAMKIEQAVEQAFSSRVDMPSGGYLFIEQTEAMHVVDVNSGRAGRGLSQEENSVRVNLEAATLIAEQVRLRDLGGILVVDFIDMRQSKNRRKVYDHLRREFRKDRAVTKVLQMSDFGLIQITRQRLRPSITHTFSIGESTDAVAANRDKSKTAVAERPSYETVEPGDLVRKIDDWLSGFREAKKKGPVKLIVHPFTAAYLNRKIPGQSIRWFLKHRLRVHIEADELVDPLSFRFVDMSTGQGVTSRPEKAEKKKDDPVKRSGGQQRTSQRRAGKQSARGDSKRGGSGRASSSRSSSQGGASQRRGSQRKESQSNEPHGGGAQRGGSQRASSEKKKSDRTGSYGDTAGRENARKRGAPARGANGDAQKSGRRGQSKNRRDEKIKEENGASSVAAQSESEAKSIKAESPTDDSSRKSTSGESRTHDRNKRQAGTQDKNNNPEQETGQREKTAGSVQIAQDLKANESTADKNTESANFVSDPVSPSPKGHVYNIDLRSKKGGS